MNENGKDKDQSNLGKKLFINVKRLERMLLNFRYGEPKISIIPHIQIGKISKNLN